MIQMNDLRELKGRVAVLAAEIQEVFEAHDLVASTLACPDCTERIESASDRVVEQVRKMRRLV